MIGLERGIVRLAPYTAAWERLFEEEKALLQAALSQDIPLAYVDADHLDVLAQLEISTQARAFIVDAVQQGYGVIVPERMVAWYGGQTIAWWQLDLETGETVGVGEHGTHDFITFTTMFMAGFMMQMQLVWIIVLLWRLVYWISAVYLDFGQNAFCPILASCAHFNRRIWGHFKNPPLYVAVSECEMCLKVAQMRFVQSPKSI
jgi:hypothetical protein